MFSHVIVGWNGSDSSDRAVTAAGEVAHRFKARLSIVEIVPPVPHGGPDEGVRRAESEEQHARGERAVRARLHPEVDVAFLLVQNDDPARALVGEAHRVGADLIVVGHHRAGALERRLTGDTAADVLRVAATPVLVVVDESRT